MRKLFDQLVQEGETAVQQLVVERRQSCRCRRLAKSQTRRSVWSGP